MTRPLRYLALLLLVVQACSWAIQAEAPNYKGEMIPVVVGINLVDNVGNKYGPKVVESLRVWGVFESIIYPYRSSGTQVDAVITLTLDALDRSGAVTASNILLGIGTLGIAGQGTDAKHRVTAVVQNQNGTSRQYTAEVDSYFHRVSGMRDEQIAQRTRYLQTSKLAHALAILFEKDQDSFTQGRR